MAHYPRVPMYFDYFDIPSSWWISCFRIHWLPRHIPFHKVCGLPSFCREQFSAKCLMDRSPHRILTICKYKYKCFNTEISFKCNVCSFDEEFLEKENHVERIQFWWGNRLLTRVSHTRPPRVCCRKPSDSSQAAALCSRIWRSPLVFKIKTFQCLFWVSHWRYWTKEFDISWLAFALTQSPLEIQGFCTLLERNSGMNEFAVLLEIEY